MKGRAGGAARQDRPNGAGRRIAELEAEVAALRRALAEAGLRAEGAADRHGAELSRERTGRAEDAAGARSAALDAAARHGREAAAGRADLAASEAGNAALRRANADLAASRAALREREERLRLVLDSAADYAIIGTDLDRRVTSWSAGAERLLGWAEAEIVGRPADLIFTPEDREAGGPEQEAEGALRDGRAENERWHVRRDGSRFWGSGLVTPLRDPEAGPAAPPVGLVKVMRDRTAERGAEEALRESEARHRALFEAIDEGFCVVEVLFDPAGRRALDYRFLEVNPAFERQTGMRGAAGRRMREFAPDHEEHWFETYGRVALTGEPTRFVNHAASLGRWYDVYAFRTGPGAARRVGILFSDITARRRAEEALREGEARFRGLFERMQEGLSLAEMVHGPGGEAVDYRFLEVNAAWERQTGVPRAAAVGRSINEVVRPDESAFWVAAYARVAATGEPEHAERRIPSLRRWFEVTMYRAGPGRVAALVSDTTDRKAAEARRDALVELGDRLRDLRDPAGIAHAAAEIIGRALGADRAGYGAVDGRETIRIERDWTAPGMASVAGEWRLPEYWTGIADALRRGEVVAVDDAAGDPRLADAAGNFAALGIRACLHVPVAERGRVEALLFVHAAEPRAWSAEEVAFARGAADRAWAAAERARSEEALRAHAARQAFRLAFEERLRALADPDAIMGEAVALLGRHLGADRVGYAEIIGDAVVRAAGSYAANGIAPLDEDFPIGAFGEGMVARQRRGVTEVCDDVLADPERAGDVWAAIDTRSVVSVPLVRGGRFRASLYVNNRAPRRWAAEDVALVEEVAARTWDAAARARAEAALRGSEGRRRAALAAARLGTFEWDPATGAVALDGRAREIFGFEPGGGGRDGEVFDRIHPGDLPRVRAASMAAAAALSRLELEYRVRLPGGAVRAVASLGDFLPGAGGGGRMVGVFADVTDRRRAEERRALLVNELNHRVKNTLAVVQSLALQTARGAADLPAFSAAFQARLIALARAHDLLTRTDWEGAPLGDVARAALEGSGARVDLSACGASGALLPPAQALALSLALHELATNALKHGALSAPDGRVSLACAVDPEDGAHVLEWAERGGPPVAGPPARRGFGLRLLERGLAAQAGMAADLRFEPGGVRCVLRLPAPPAHAPAGAA